MRLAHETEVDGLAVYDNLFLIANENAIARQGNWPGVLGLEEFTDL
jgi:hypothetical protein